MLSTISSWFDKQTAQEQPVVTNWQKSDIVNWLAVQYGYKTYLEIATATTGGQYSLIDRDTFALTERLLYRTPANFDDGMKIDYRCEPEDNRIALAQLRGEGKTYDLVFVDSYHMYAGSMSDLENAIELLATRGTLVVHDCNPMTADLVTPEYVPGTCWCGLTYAAFLDFVHRRADLDFCVVDTDWGVGIVRRKQDFPTTNQGDVSMEATRLRQDVIAQARQLEWDYFDAHRQRLLHLVSVDEFLASYARPKGWMGRFFQSRKRHTVA
jgi:hypothetical protein